MKDADIVNQFENLLSFEWTWAFRIFLYLPFDIIGMFSGNQWGKSANCAINYVFRIMGWHPIPRKNVLYFECPNLVKEEKKAEKEEDDDLIKHPWVSKGFSDGSRINIHREGEYFDSCFYPRIYPARNKQSLRPEDNECTFCGEKLRVHKRKTRIFRFASENLPGDNATTENELGGQSTEVRNATYPEFKKWLPNFLIKKDITSRKTAITLHDPNKGHNFGDIEYAGADIVIEFVSYSQEIQAGAGVQRLSVWEDEESPMAFHEEQMPRLVAEDGDLLISLTPANRISWTYDEIFERSQLYIRTKAICDFLDHGKRKENNEEGTKRIEWTENDTNIAIIQAASDDNPTLSKKAIEKKYFYDDPDTVATRRYGIFRQATGRIFTDMSYKIHVLDFNRYFVDGIIPEINYVHARSIDYHERNPWAIIWVALSTQDEAFVYREWSPVPLKWVNVAIAEEIAHRSEMQKYVVNLIDPLARKIQTNTGMSVIEDLNRAFFQFKRDGICSGGFWEPFDTKGTKGRDEIRKRLKNANLVGRPFNNEIVREGRKITLPTLWISKNCPETAKSLKQWRYEDWATSKVIAVKDKREVPAQKFSHFCTALEGIFKDNRFRPRKQKFNNLQSSKRGGMINRPQYFQVSGRV